MSDSTFGLDGSDSSDDWTSSYASPNADQTKKQALGAANTPSPAPASASDASYTPSYASGAAATSLGAPSPDPNLPAGSNVYLGSPSSPGPTAGPDPVAADQKARSIANSLQAAGHQVTWQGNQLMVDGRPYDVTATGAPTGAAPSGAAPTLNVSDPTSRQAFISYYANQPGANPSLKNDPGYWDGVIGSGSLGQDPGYIVQKFMTPEGAPAGAGGGVDTGLVPSYAQVSAVGNPGALSPNIAMPDAPWGDSGIPTYQPGEIGFGDIPNFTPESLQAQMNSGGASTSLDALIKSIEDNPTSLDDHTVDTMKASMKDTLAEQGQLNDEMTKGQAGMLGIGDSPWLASERAAARRSTGQAIAAGGQNIDIQAGQTRQAQKIASAGAGQAYQNSKNQQVMDTVNAGLQRATVTGNRMALRESVAQAAAASKQSAYQIQAQWLESQTGQKISAAALAQQGQEFAESLMMQIAGANVGVQEFGANYGLGAASLQHTIDNDDWSHSYLDSQNLTPTG